MPAPKRKSVDDFYAQLPEAARPHLRKLQELSKEAAPKATEELKWNQPAFVLDEILWMLQAFKNHCSLRFPLQNSPTLMADHRAEVEAAGYEAIEGAIKLPYDKPVPAKLITTLLKARLAERESKTA